MAKGRKTKREANQGVEEAIKRFGSCAKMSQRLNVSPSTISYWRYTDIPAERAIQLEAETGVSKSKMRPDLFKKKR